MLHKILERLKSLSFDVLASPKAEALLDSLKAARLERIKWKGKLVGNEYRISNLELELGTSRYTHKLSCWFATASDEHFIKPVFFCDWYANGDYMGTLVIEPEDKAIYNEIKKALTAIKTALFAEKVSDNEIVFRDNLFVYMEIINKKLPSARLRY